MHRFTAAGKVQNGPKLELLCDYGSIRIESEFLPKSEIRIIERQLVKVLLRFHSNDVIFPSRKKRRPRTFLDRTKRSRAAPLPTSPQTSCS